MTQYNCKFQLYRDRNLYARRECEGCSPDAVNNPNCPNYEPVNLNHFWHIKKRGFVVDGRAVIFSNLERER